MAKKASFIPERLRVWIEARNKHHLSHTHIAMARELGMNPQSFSKLDNHRQERWKAPLPAFIESLYLKRFGKSKPDIVLTIEQLAKQLAAKKQEKREAKLQRKSETAPKDDALRVESKNQILFLCTWNYYRSRFAEIYFNWEAAAANIDWRADSRGLALPESIPNTLSKYTIDYLARLAIPYDTLRKPMDATEDDFAKADRVIAIKRAEHHPIIQKRFETFADRVEYWDIHDIDASTPEEQLPLLHAQVRSLITDLASAYPNET